MERFASVIRIVPEHAAEYRALHEAVRPGVLEALRAAHVRNYSIFERDGLLFSYLEYDGEDYRADMERVAADRDTQLWWRLTDPCQRPLDTVAPGERWAAATERFHMD